MFSFGQEIWAIKVIDSQTKSVIPTATLSVNKTVYFPTDGNGNISLEIKATKKGDTLFLSCLGYQTLKLVFTEANQLPKEVSLTPVIYRLNEVTIINGKREQKEIILGTTAFSLSQVLTQFNYKYGLYIRNSKSIEGIIKTIRIHMRDGAKSINMPFKIRLFAKSLNSNFPGAELMDEIITENTKGKKWFSVDIEHLGIKLPSEGFFIVFQTMPAAYYSKLPAKIHGREVSSVPGLAFTTFPKSVNKENYAVTGFGNGNWSTARNIEYQMQAKILIQN